MQDSTMWALAKKKPEEGLWMERVPVPEVGLNDMRIKIHKTATCGTDVHIYQWDDWAQHTIPIGLTTGHGYVREIVETGTGVTGHQVGDLVSRERRIICGQCRNCLEGHKENCKDTKGVGVNRNGAFAEYLVIPSSDVWPCNPAIPEKLYAIFNPFGNATHTALTYNVLGEDVLIAGTGPIGIMAAAIVKFCDACYVMATDLNDYRLDLAKELGATRTVNLRQETLTNVMKKIGMTEDFDAGMEMSGSPAGLADMIHNMKHGGKVALLGLQGRETVVDLETVVSNGLDIRGIYGRKVWDTWYKMTVMLQAGLGISEIITHRSDIRDYEKGFAAMISGQSDKVVLDWSHINDQRRRFEHMARKNDILSIYAKEMEDIREAGLFKGEAPITSVQGAHVVLEDRREVINMCASSCLGLSNDQKLIGVAKKTYDDRGYDMASVRFICGTQNIHKRLEVKISGLLRTDDAILCSSCSDADGGLFEILLTDSDAVISDELNHASIVNGVRLRKAERYRYKNNDMADLEERLREADAAGARIELIATDDVFSMDGIICNPKGVCSLADQYNALVMVDDSHAVGFIGEYGRGTAEYNGVEGRVDTITGTLGKALGEASGGYTSGWEEIIDLLRQRSRPYLFSNTLAPAIVGAGLELFDMLEESTALRDTLEETTVYYRKLLTDNDFDIIPETHPCMPVMLYDEELAGEFARRMMEKGVYIIAFSFPVVPKGKARIRIQVCASHTEENIDFIVKCFMEVREEMGLS